MGSITYDFLADSFLLNSGNISNEYSDFTIDQIQVELENYRQHCLANYDALHKEVTEKESSLKVFSSIEKTSFELLMQPSIYLEQFIIYDPLFKFTETESEVSRVASEYLGFKEKSIDKSELAKTCAFLRRISPMIAADYVKILPFSYHFEAPKQLAINLPVNYYNEILPQEILEYFWMNVLVNSMVREEDGWRITDKLFPCRGIHIDFRDYNAERTFIYHLWELVSESLDETTGKALFRQTLPDTPPNSEYFKAWVNQSVNSASKAIYDKVFLENIIASQLNATYLSDSPFIGNLLTTHFGVADPKNSIQGFTATELLNMDLPFLSNIDVSELMAIRKHEEGVFQNFRLELERHFRELREITDPNELALAKENVIHELNDVQVNQIQRTMKNVTSNMKIDALLLTGGMVATAAPTMGLSLLAIALGLGKGYKDFKDYQDKVKENPSYLLWKSRN